MLRSDNFSLLQASIVTIAEPSLPLLILPHNGVVVSMCQVMCIFLDCCT